MTSLALSGCSDPDPGGDPGFTVTIAENITGGTVSASPTRGPAGTTVTLSNTPNSGYTFSHYTVDGAPITGNIFTLNGNATVGGVFSARGTAVTLYWVNEQGQLAFTNGGTASVTSAGSVTITPQGEGYTGQFWYVNGAEDRSKAGQASYTFNGTGKTADRYTIGLRAAKNGRYYYAECIVTVAN